MTFERYTELLTKCFQTLHKDVDQRYSDHQKVEKVLKGITMQEPELSGAKAVIDMLYPRDFTGACTYFSTQVARVHGPAVLEGKPEEESAVSTRLRVVAEATGEAADILEDVAMVVWRTRWRTQPRAWNSAYNYQWCQCIRPKSKFQTPWRPCLCHAAS